MLSVIVVITSGEEHVGRCLEALASQVGPPKLEVIIPIYRPERGSETKLAAGRPWVRFVEIPEPPPGTPALQHLEFDRRRAVGVAAAGGEVIAMTEDHAIPAKDWCAAIWRLHSANTSPVIGGAIRFAGTGMLNRAVYYCDFARYEPPLTGGATDYVSDINVSYKRRDLEHHRATFEHFYDEVTVHGAIREAGGVLHITPELTVAYDRGRLKLSRVLWQRFIWGRVYAGRRAAREGAFRRFGYAILSPALPFLLFGRKLRMAARPGHRLGPFLAASIPTFLCLIFWSSGEFTGYLTSRPYPRIPGTEDAAYQRFGNF